MRQQHQNRQQKGNFDLGDYKQVDERLREFFEKYPDGRLESEVVHWPTDGNGFIAVKAYVYRSPDDQHPATGLAWEPVPGTTPYTRNSELQNAETSAWGRALVAGGYADTKHGIASAEEVRNRRAEPPIVDHVIAKTKLVDAANGDKALAARIWGDRGNRSIPEPELDELIAAVIEAAAQSTTEQGEAA